MDRILSSFKRPFNLDALFKASDITPQIRSHLSKTYATLALTTFCAFLGVLAHLMWGIGGLISALSCFCLMYLLASDPDKSNVNKRLALISGFGFFQGVSLGPLVNAALVIDPSVLIVAFLATTTIFVCFSINAVFSERRSWFFLSGLLSSVLSYLVLLGFLNIFFGLQMIFNIQLYVGLFLFCGYVLYDSQLIIEKAALGNEDFVWDAMELFVDFVAIFARILIILMQNSEKKNKKRKD